MERRKRLFVQQREVVVVREEALAGLAEREGREAHVVEVVRAVFRLDIQQTTTMMMTTTTVMALLEAVVSFAPRQQDEAVARRLISAAARLGRATPLMV